MRFRAIGISGVSLAIAVCTLMAVPAHAADGSDDGGKPVVPAVTSSQAQATFDMDFSLGGVTPSEAWDKINACFNCYFPLSGTPAKLPPADQPVPFAASFITDHDDLSATVKTYNFGEMFSEFQLDAAPGNITGLGSVVAFGFYVDGTGQPTMSVAGMITADLGDDKGKYLSASAATWATFAENLRTLP